VTLPGTDESLAESQTWLEFVLEAGQLGTWEWDLSTDAVRWSATLERIHGLRPGTFASTFAAYAQSIHPEDRERVLDEIRQALEAGRRHEVEYRICLPDGSIRWVLGRGRVLRDPDGRPVRMIGVCLDTTAHKQLEHELRALSTELEQRSAERAAQLAAADQRFKSVCDLAPIGIFLKDPAGACIYTNDRLQLITGRPAVECLGDGWQRALHPEDRERVRAAVVRATERGREYSLETRLLTPGGSVRWVHSRTLPLLGADGRFVGYIGVVEDITDRKQAESELRQVLAGARCLLWHATVHANPAGPRWELRMWDETVAQRFLPLAIPAGQGYAAAWYQSKLPEDRERMDRVSREALETGQSGYRQEFRCRREDGEVRWLLEDAHIEAMAPGLWRVIGVCADITERKWLEEALLQSRKLEATGRLAGGVAHEFNNLLAVVMGYVDLLISRGDLPVVAERQLGMIVRAAERGAELTRQLVAFSRQQLVQPRGLDLNQFLTDQLGLLQPLIGEHITIELDRAPDLWLARADEGVMQQVLVQLTLNARDAMPQGGCLTLATKNVSFAETDPQRPVELAPGEFVELCVSDTGKGIEASLQERIFEPFFTTKEVGEGTGLSLAAVYGAVRQCNGQIGVESIPGRCTSFRIRLPRWPGSA
jgi:PAS domain S-box-containing protein